MTLFADERASTFKAKADALARARQETVNLLRGLSLLFAIGKVAETETLRLYGVAYAHTVATINLAILGTWALAFPFAYEVASSRSTFRAKAKTFALALGVAGLLTLAIAPPAIHQPARPVLSAILILGGIGSFFAFVLILAVWSHRKSNTSALPDTSVAAHR